MITDEHLVEIEKLMRRHNVTAGYMFGSHATGRANQLSDVDIAVLFAEGVDKQHRFNAVLDMISDFQAMLGVREVDVVDMEEAPLSLRFNILRDGLLLYCSDAARRVEFCARSRSLYFDFEPARDVYRHYLMKRIKEGKLGQRPERKRFTR